MTAIYIIVIIVALWPLSLVGYGINLLIAANLKGKHDELRNILIRMI